MIQIGKRPTLAVFRPREIDVCVAGDAPLSLPGALFRTILVNSRAFSRSPKFARAVVEAPYFALSQQRLNQQTTPPPDAPFLEKYACLCRLHGTADIRWWNLRAARDIHAVMRRTLTGPLVGYLHLARGARTGTRTG
jgi:hypothetical protein